MGKPCLILLGGAGWDARRRAASVALTAAAFGHPVAVALSGDPLRAWVEGRFDEGAPAGAQEAQVVDWLEKVTDTQYRNVQAPKTSATTAVQPSRAQQLMGDFAPKLAELTDSVLFGDIWERPGLSKRDRSLVTVSALVAMNRPEQLRSHLTLAIQNGLTREELAEAMTHLAFYSGWPSAVSAISVAKEVLPAKSPN